MVGALQRKLLRDLWRLRGQVISIALVVACGIASFITMRSAYASLLESRNSYYVDYAFADLFASLKRAPENLKERLYAIPGVALVHTRVVEPVMIPLPTMPRPASGTVLSLPDGASPPLNRVYIAKGRALEAGRSDEALLLRAFAEAHGIEPGDSLRVVVNGRMRRLRIVGLAMSPEHVLTMPPGGLTHDPKRFAALWMNRSAVGAAFDMEGAFSDAVFALQPGADSRSVMSQIDQILEPYGGVGSVSRERQPSNFMISGEIMQLENMATVVPAIFLLVAAFLLNVVLSRLILLERSQIATLKAIGYRDLQVGLHYVEFTSVIVLLGVALGTASGAYLGEGLTNLYTSEFFKFPETRFILEPGFIATAVAISLAAAFAGALGSARAVALLPPAEAMRPASPVRYRKTLLERLGLFWLFSASGRMIWREVERRPLRQVLSALGIAMAVGIVMISGFMKDAVDYLMRVQFHEAMREDVTVTFVKPLDERAIRELGHVPGVLSAQGLRVTPVRFRAGHHYRDAAITGYPEASRFRRLLDSAGKEHEIPEQGLVMTEKLAEILELEVGDSVIVELREGGRAIRELPLTGLVDEPFGLAGHMAGSALQRLLREAPSVSMALLEVDPEKRATVERRLKELPWVGGVSSPSDFKTQFDEQSGQFMGLYTLILTLFASIIAVGVIYNNARVALSQRSRDLASLRVLGFQRSEITRILLGELSLQVILAIPIGMWIGRQMIISVNATVDPETYRLPVFVSAGTYAYAALVALASAALSALLVRRKIAQLDMIGVLKTRE